jgi:phage antirepressor YoqD-like protein
MQKNIKIKKHYKKVKKTIDKEKNYTEVAKLLNIKPLFFINKLRVDGYITQTRLPYQRYIENGYFVVKYAKVITYFKNEAALINDITKPSFLITPKGFNYFSKKYL